MAEWNPWLALLLGVAVGWLFMWLLDMLFFRRRNVEMSTYLADATAEAKAYNADMEGLRQQMQALRTDLDKHLADVAAIEGLRQQVQALRTDLDKHLADVAVMEDLRQQVQGLRTDLDSHLAEVVMAEPSAPQVVAASPEAEDQPSGIGLPGAVALGAAGAAALRGGEISVETPVEEVAAPAAVLAGAAIEAEEPLGGVAVEVPDDLTRIKGIGPKYARLLNVAGITTYGELAAADNVQLQSITNPPAWQKVDYDAWRTQAGELALAPRPVRIGDDFTRLEGIGPKYAAALKEHGVTAFAQLAESDESSLAAIVRPPAWQRVVYAEWIEQARLAAAGDEAGLAELQAALFRREGDKLTLITGVGEKSASALRAAGIGTFAALAATTPEQLDNVISNAGLRQGDYAAWIAEAELRSAGKRVKRSHRTAAGAFTYSPCPQDLSRVHGIGDVYEQKLYAAGIGTYWELASASEADLRTILDIKDFQAIDLAAIRQAASNLAEETGSFGRAWDGSEPDDLASIEGIGETFERRLYEAGICTFAALAGSTPERLAEISQAPAWQQVDYAGWIERARERVPPRDKQ